MNPVQKYGLLIMVNMFFGNVALHSQLLPVGYKTNYLSQEFILDAGGDFCSSSIENELISKFITGGFINQEVKDNSFNRHGAINRIGGVFGAELEYRNYKKLFAKRNWGFLIRGSYGAFGGMIYSKDLFGLGFYGNQMYMGETIDLSGTNFTYMAYQKIGFGLIESESKSNVSFNIYNISDRISGNLEKVQITQDEAGDEVNLVLNGRVEMKNNNSFSQGIGFGFDLDFYLPVAWLDNQRAFLRFQAKNVGFAYMHEKQKIYSFDTSFTFDGWRFDEIIGENSLFQDSLNLLDTMGIYTKEDNRTVMLPGFLQIGKIVDEQSMNEFQSFFGLRFYPSLIYNPYIFAGLDYKAAKWIRIGLNAAYGGFGKFRAGLYTSCRFKNYSLGIASENILGFFMKNGNGQSLFIKLRCAIP
jgi:hypothetical protein